MIHTDENDNQYFESLEEVKIEGYTPIKVNNRLQFFQLEGRKTVMVKDNIIPLAGIPYVVLAKYPGGDRYFLRTYHNYSLDELFWYRRSDTFSGSNEAIENLRKYIEDKRVTLLYTKEQIATTSEMLRRIYYAQFKTEGQLDYTIYLKLLETSLKFEDYKDVGKNLTGFKTLCNQFEISINELWKKAMR